jgi:hypothetical protein
MNVPSPADRASGPLAVRVDRRRLAGVLSDFVAGSGILVLYIGCVVGSLYLAGLAVVSLRDSIAVPPEMVKYLAAGVGLAVWLATYRAAAHLLLESGVELGPAVRWLLLPAAPAAFALVVTVHLLGAIGTDTRGPLRGLGYLLGALLLFAVVATVLSLVL